MDISSLQSLSHVWLFATLWTSAHQASLSITNSQSLLILMSIMSVMPSNHLILCHPLLILPLIFPSIRIYCNESVLNIRWWKYWSFSFSINPSNEYSGLISFRIDWFDLLAVQGTIKSLLQHHSSKASILQHSPFFKGNQSWTFIGRIDAETETPILRPPDSKNWLIGKDPDAGKDWRQEEKGTTEDEMVEWHHWLDGQEFKWAPGVGDGQGRLVCCSPWGCKELDMTERLNWSL